MNAWPWAGLRDARRLWIPGVLLLAAGLLRLDAIPESRFMAERQYRSALIARAEYLSTGVEAEVWEREIAQVSAERMGRLEPPVMEWLTVQGYLLAGRERPAIARALSMVFWLLGGLFVYLLAGRVVGEGAAKYSLAYFLFLPLGVLVSTSFIPDALMLALFVAGLLGIVKHEEDPSWRKLVLAGLACGASVLVKPLCVFALLGAWLALRWSRTGFRGVLQPSWWVLVAFLLLPALAYYAQGILIEGFLADQAAVSFVPGLLLRTAFWRDTAMTSVTALGGVPLALALMGACLPQGARARPLLAGLTAGYLALLVSFTFHVRIAPHYHLQFAVATAIALGPAVGELVDAVRARGGRQGLRAMALATAVLVLAGSNYRNVRQAFQEARPVVSRSVAEAVGEAVGHSSRVVYVSQYYGIPLEYFGRLSGWFWDRPSGVLDRAMGLERPRTIEERLASLASSVARADPDFRPDYFVVTDFEEFVHHPDLAAFLGDRCELLARDPAYLVYGECRLDS